MNPRSTFFTANSMTKDPLDLIFSQLDFVPKLFGHQYNNPDSVCSNRIIGDFELIYIIGGESIITIDNQEYVCRAGDVVIIPPFTKHSINTPLNNLHNNYWIHFDVNPIYKHEQFLDILVPLRQYRLSIGLLPRLTEIFKAITKEYCVGKPCCVSYIQTLLSQAFIEIFRTTNSNLISGKLTPDDNHYTCSVVDLAIEYIKQNISSPIKLTDICKHIHISESTLSKAFSKLLGISAGKYILLFKMKQTELLLKTTDKTVNEISQEFGFSSAYHFSLIFKRIYGVAPSLYRQSNNM